VLHAAAYKHVPIVEESAIQGFRNNMSATLTLALQAQKAGVSRFVLLSTDKAVRPTGIMGASKRMAELIVQDIATRAPGTVFSIVRFGNVLGSSGSVVPLFQEQVSQGGPVTLTHRDVTRYFMTVREAAQLVLTAGTFSSKGGVFVLDMGKPRKIYQLARQVIEASGYTVLDEDHPNGDIEILEIGLRPGEKMHEELLISGTRETTEHSKIYRAKEDSLSEIEMARAIRDFQDAFDRFDEGALRKAIETWVEGFSPANRFLEAVDTSAG
jgi:FlaA1/EpsC-like NDP-sugar epimerase